MESHSSHAYSQKLKQNIVARASVEVGAVETCKLVWIKQLLQELHLGDIESMKLICDNQAALHIASALACI